MKLTAAWQAIAVVDITRGGGSLLRAFGGGKMLER
jgi:hypothetical protein